MFEILKAIDFLRAFAAVLITNSHFDNLYPNPSLSVGGALGNAIFFFISGYCLSQKVYSVSLGHWIKTKIIRIYPALWFCSILAILAGYYEIKKQYILRIFLFPYNSYWLVCAIMIYYVVFYFVAQLEKKQLQWLMALNVLAYFMLYFSTRDLNKWCVEAPDYFKYVFYFGVMLVGYYSRVSKITKKEIPWGMISIASLIGYFISKIVVNYDNKMMRFQFLVQMATLSFAMSTVIWAINKEAFFETFCEGHRKIETIIRHIGASTLEIYLLNYAVVSYSSAVSFPVNIGIAFICIFSIGVLLHGIIEKMVSYVRKMWR